jgi:nucleoid-associated protein YgaU
MTSRPALRTGRSLVRLIVAGAVVVGAPLAVAGTANAASTATWDKLAQCESGGNWSINTGNGYYGGLQFSAGTWRAYGGSGLASNASKSQQIAVAERVLAAQGWNAWPSCSRKTGASGAAEPGKVVRASAPAPKAPVSKAAAPKAAAPKAPAPKAAPAPTAAPVAPVVKNGADYTVVAGDSLSKIATEQKIPGGWRAIWERNTDVVSDPDLILIGQQLDLR